MKPDFLSLAVTSVNLDDRDTAALPLVERMALLEAIVRGVQQVFHHHGRPGLTGLW
jgi:hypothetical protein